jgi:short-subunit dehydrogenase
MKPAGCALVTGASRGIGNHFARALASRSRDLIIVARSKDQLDQLARELSGAFGVRVEAVALDLTMDGAAAELKQVVSDRGLDVDLLVNNAGFGDKKEFLKTPPADQANMIRLNTLALVEITYHFLPPMIARRKGAIINVSSTAGFQPMPYVAVYAATKAFVTSFSMALAEEVRSQGVCVVTLCPGPTRTEPETPENSQSSFPGGRQPAEELVEEALNQIERNGGLVVPRLINKAMAFSNRLMPLHVSAKVVSRMTRPKDT